MSVSSKFSPTTIVSYCAQERLYDRKDSSFCRIARLLLLRRFVNYSLDTEIPNFTIEKRVVIMRTAVYWVCIGLLLILGLYGAWKIFSRLLLWANAQSDRGITYVSDHFVGQPTIPTELYFAGERIPLENSDVRESLDRELCVATNWHSQMLLMLKRSTRYFPEIEPILRSNQIPDDFKYLAVAESSLNERAYSPSKAAGIWQFLEGVGRDYGLIINDEVDQRYDLSRATKAACDYLQTAYRRFGSWMMAAAAYNMGQNGLQRVMAQQGEHRYTDLHLNIETARYLFRILALKLVLENPELYGFRLRASECYKPYQYNEIVVRNTIPDLALYAQSQHTNYKMLRLLNPWLRGTVLTIPLGQEYTLRIVDSVARVF